MMTRREFKKQFNYAPLIDYEFAESALEVTDAPKLVAAASAFLNSRENFYAALKAVGVEIG